MLERPVPGPSFLRLRRATSVVAVAPTQVDSGRFSVVDEDLGDTEVDEGGDTADFRESTVNESPRVPAIVMSDAEGPIVGRRRLVLVSQQEVAPTVMDAPSAISRDLHAESNVESIPVDSESDTASLPASDVEPLGSLAFSAEARAAMSFFDTCEVEGEFLDMACVMKSPPAFLKGAHRCVLHWMKLTRLVHVDIMWVSLALFMLLPRLLLHKPPRGGLVP